MNNYKNILLATNLQPDNQKVGDAAKAFAERIGAKLSIVHVFGYLPMLYGANEFAIPLNGDIETTAIKQAQLSLTKEGERLGIPAANHILERGDTREGLVALINKSHFDMLIMGSHEHHGLGFFGSATNSLLHAMPCDILAIRLAA